MHACIMHTGCALGPLHDKLDIRYDNMLSDSMAENISFLQLTNSSSILGDGGDQQNAENM